MGTFIMKRSKIFWEGQDLSGILSQVALSYGVNLQNESAFGDDTEINRAGIETFSATQTGFWSVSEDEDLFPEIGGDRGIWSAVPEEGLAGEIGFFAKMVAGNYSPGAAHGELYGFTLDFSPGDVQSGAARGKGLVRGTVLEAVAAKTASGNGGTGQNIGTVSSTQRLWGAMHVVLIGGTNPVLDLKVESDVDDTFSTPTDRLTFNTVTGLGQEKAQLKSAPGPITPDTFFRANWTISDDSAGSPSFTLFLIVGIK